MLASVTRLHLRSWRFLPQFFWTNEKIVRQIRAAEGFREGRLLGELDLTFWTASLWDSKESMRAFRDHDAHSTAMPKLVRWCDEAAVAEMTDRASLPAWGEAHEWIKIARTRVDTAPSFTAPRGTGFSSAAFARVPSSHSN